MGVVRINGCGASKWVHLNGCGVSKWVHPTWLLLIQPFTYPHRFLALTTSREMPLVWCALTIWRRWNGYSIGKCVVRGGMWHMDEHIKGPRQQWEVGSTSAVECFDGISHPVCVYKGMNP